MLAFKFTAILAAVATVVIAHPTIRVRQGGCSTGTLQCCDSIAPAESSSAGELAGLLPISTQNANTPLGINCIPADISGAGSAGTCSTQAACCDNVDNSGETPIGVNCSPFNTGL